MIYCSSIMCVYISCVTFTFSCKQYQFWCEEASATIARVGKFSSECRSTDAVSVLYQQFEKFVWPTVPEQEERISQIAELAVRLHGESPTCFIQPVMLQIYSLLLDVY